MPSLSQDETAARPHVGSVLSEFGRPERIESGKPGFFFGTSGKSAPRDVLRNQPHGRIAFANTDLAGASDHRNSIREADRAVKQLL